MSLAKRDNLIYGNCKMLAPDGTLLCRCDQEKADWYLSRGLATVESDNPVLIFRLNFEPKGRGNAGELFYLSDKHNRCVVCGTTEDLTRHHCVPRCYRRHFPAEYKFHTSHDVLPCCIPCHHRYEPFAWEKKVQLAQQNGLTINNAVEFDTEHQVAKHAIALYRHGDKIPAARQEVLLQTLRDYYGRQEIAPADIEEATHLNGRPLPAEDATAKIVVQNVRDLDAFVIEWRQHFVDKMQPKFLPDHWSVMHETKRGE